MEAEKVRSYRDLLVWQKGMDLSVNCYRLTKPFPKAEIYGLRSQIRRAEISIPTNIAEGYGRQSTDDYIRFRIAQGSTKELETLLELSNRVDYCTDSERILRLKICDETGRMIRSLIRTLERRLK